MSGDYRLCAFCASKRRVYLKRHAGIFDFASAVAMSVLLMWVRWQEFNPKVFVILVAVFMAMEVFVHLRYRLNLTCQFCGFDPVLYKKNPAAAAKVVKQRLEDIRLDPDFLLSERAQNTLKRLKRMRRAEVSAEAQP